ncbi:hypothetical protein [Achromobacter animicus]|uniref:hypothetical protein n=1 Tax=Achromobacter animicus TaxID=1389935 RepID=UPI001582EC2A
MDIRSAQQRAQAFRRLQIQKDDARQAAAFFLQRRAFRALAAEQKPQAVLAVETPRHVRQNLKTLLAAHIPRIQRDDGLSGMPSCHGNRRLRPAA